jgi:anti-anti-sigma regulatory factor
MTGPSTSLLRIGVDPAQALNLSVTGDADAPVIRLAGPLRRRDAPAVRETLRHAMVECPAAVVVDLTGLVVLDDDAMRVFPAVRRGGDWWPGTELIASAPSPKVRALLDAQPDLFDRCLPSADEALITAWCDGARPRSVREPIAASAGAGRRAREVIHQFCATWDLDAILPRASAVVTELVDNAVLHADGDNDVMLTASVWRDYLRIAVRDRDPGPLPRSRPGRLDAFGYGRRLVEECSVNWGVSETSDGKIVWSTLRIPRAAGALDTPPNPEANASPAPTRPPTPPPAPPPPPVLTPVHNRSV